MVLARMPALPMHATIDVAQAYDPKLWHDPQTQRQWAHKTQLRTLKHGSERRQGEAR